MNDESFAFQKEQGCEWQWPIDVAAYDRSPFMHEQEQRELDLVLSRIEMGNYQWSAQSKCILHRLIQPIADVFSCTGANKRARSAVRTLVLRHMKQSGQPFWTWSSEVWISILCKDHCTFTTQYKLPSDARQHLIALAYWLGNFTALYSIGKFDRYLLAVRTFGAPLIDAAIQRVCNILCEWGYGHSLADRPPKALCELLLVNRSPYLEDLSLDVIQQVCQESTTLELKEHIVKISRVLTTMGILLHPLEHAPRKNAQAEEQRVFECVSPEWEQWCHRWLDTSTLAPRTRRKLYCHLLQVGRWLMQVHPEVVSPDQWSRGLAAEFVAAVDRAHVGQWAGVRSNIPAKKRGTPLSPRSKALLLGAIRVFLRDCQEWNWMGRRFDPTRCLSVPRSIRALIAPNPRVIADDIWAKLLWAGLNLTTEDLPDLTYEARRSHAYKVERAPWYPLEMVRAIVIVWLFAGLRSDEIYRLRVGAVRWQREEVAVQGSDETLAKDAICWLDVPVNKTGTAFTKAVDRVVGEAIEAWERVRPSQPPALDPKTSEQVHFLFFYRGKRMGIQYINQRLIPMLCRKAGIPTSDARGNITSHRARSTIASQLFNAKEPLTLFELQEWLGHRNPDATRHYAKKSPTKLAKAYERAGYFERNLRIVEVLIDQEAIKSGTVVDGSPWKFYDLGHGYCTYDFFDQCPHRMACAKCAFYRPKESSSAQMLEAKANLLRLKQEIPLSDEEQAAVDDGLEALEKLCERLIDIPTPAGPTPKELLSGGKRLLPMAKALGEALHK